MKSIHRTLGLLVVAIACAAGCAKMPPPLPATLRYPDFVYPMVPTRLQQTSGAAAVERGWRFLQNDDLGAAEREFGSAAKAARGFYPAETGQGYVSLARRAPDKALTAFDRALATSPDYVPALVGRGQALLALTRDEEALTTFERALALDRSLADLQRRVELLRFRNVQDVIERARTAASAGRLDEARAAYERAITASPDSAFLYRELGSVERRQGSADAALTHLRRATELDPSDAAAWSELASLLETRGDFDAALENLRKAADLEPTPELTARLAAVSARAREAKLPPEFRAIPQSTQVTRGELAALLGIRLEPLLASAPRKQVVVTDARTHWAGPWITVVAEAGVMDAFENHTFQPQTRLRRSDLAAAVSRVLGLVAARNPALRARLAERPRIADVSTDHLSYPSVATAVASGVMPLVDGQRFQLQRPVTGAEALEVVTRLRAIAGLQ